MLKDFGRVTRWDQTDDVKSRQKSFLTTIHLMGVVEQLPDLHVPCFGQMVDFRAQHSMSFLQSSTRTSGRTTRNQVS